MKEISPKQRLEKRKRDAFTQLGKVVSTRKINGRTRTVTFTKIAQDLDLTPQTVYNYIRGKGGDGYVIDALIEQFNKLP